jgi:hypothetical protein
VQFPTHNIPHPAYKYDRASAHRNGGTNIKNIKRHCGNLVLLAALNVSAHAKAPLLVELLPQTRQAPIVSTLLDRSDIVYQNARTTLNPSEGSKSDKITRAVFGFLTDPFKPVLEKR